MQQQRRPLLRVARVALALALYAWAGKAFYLFAVADYSYHYGTFARAYLAARDSFFSLPDMIAWAVEAIGLLLVWGHQALIGDLGYDPLGSSGLSLPSWGDWSAAMPNGLPGAAKQAALAGGGVAVSQAVMLVGIMASGCTVSWRAPGLPVVVNVRPKLVYTILSLTVAAVLAYAAFQVSLVAGIAAAVIALLCVRLPLIAGLPLWVLDRGLGLHPRHLVALPKAILTRMAGFSAPFGKRESDAGASGQTNGGKHEQTWHGQSSSGADNTRQQERSRESSTPGLGQSHEVDCALFNLEPDSFDRATLTKRYRERMKMLHPDHDGDEAATKRLNAAYERILEHHGWRR